MEEKENPNLEQQKDSRLESLKYRSAKEIIKSLINGFFIGLAIIVPGVSGSTISMIFKLYDKMMLAIANIFKKFKIAVLFLLPLLGGLIVGFILGFFAVQQLVNNFMFICISLFGGLMLGGAKEVHKEIKTDNIKDHKVIDWILLGLGLILPIALSVTFVFLKSGLSLETDFAKDSFPLYLYFVVLAFGLLISLTQIIPGLSATALLMTFGAFTPIVDSVSITMWQNKPLWFVMYLLLAAGFVVGILLLAKLFNYLLIKYRFHTFHLLTGLAYGSVVSIFYNAETAEIYNMWSKGEGNIALDLGIGIPLFIVGFIISFCLIYFNEKHNKKTAKE